MRSYLPALALIGLLILGLSIGVLIGMNSETTPTSSLARAVSGTLTLSPAPSPIASPQPSASPVLPAEIKQEWPSPNGKSILILNSKAQSSTTTLYSFSTKTESEPTEVLVFSKAVQQPASLTIPFNSWAPDNKYFFVQEKDGQNTKNFVLTANGQPFKDGEPLIDVNSTFTEKVKEFQFKNVTGWAAPGLLIVNSSTADNQDGPSFWFEINRKSFIRLSTSFQ
jgi:hypothetical protein